MEVVTTTFVSFLSTNSIDEQKKYLKAHPEKKDTFIRQALTYLNETQQNHSSDLQLKAWFLLPKSQARTLPLPNNNSSHPIPKKFEGELIQNVMSSREFWRLRQLSKLGVKISPREKSALLQEACQRGDLQSVKMLLSLHARVNSVNHEGMTPLHLAFQEGHIEVGKLLIEKGAGVLFLDATNKTPLHYLCESGNHEEATEIYKHYVNGLLQQANPYNTQSHFGDLSLMLAIYESLAGGLTSIAKNLIAQLEDLNRIDPTTGNTLIHNLTRSGVPHLEIFEYLKERGADFEVKNAEGKTPLAYALSLPDPNVHIETLLKVGAKTDFEDGSSALHQAVKNPQTSRATIERLIQQGTDITTKDKEGHTPFHYACRGSTSLQVVKCLLDAGAKPDLSDLPFLLGNHHSSEEDLIPVAKQLIDQLKNINRLGAKTGNALIHNLIRTGNPNLEVLRYLKEKGLDFETKNAKGKTPLAYALSLPNPNRHLKELLEVGVQTDFADSSAINQALKNPKITFETIEILIAHGANVNFKDKEGNTPLHYACRPPANLNMIKLLLQAGAKLDTQDADGDTSLHIAVFYHEVNVVEFLHSQGANFYILNKVGESPAWLMRMHAFPILTEIQNSPIVIEYELRRLLSGCFSLGVSSSFEGMTIDLEGGRKKQGINKVAELLNQLNSQSSDFLNLDEVCETLEKGVRRSRGSPQKISEGFSAGKTFIFNTGWKDHIVQVIFIDDYMLIVNRGKGRKKASIETFKITRGNGLNKNSLMTLINPSSLTYRKGSHFLYEELPKELQATQNDPICEVIREKCQQSDQKSGNCWWLSPKSGVLGLLTIQALLAESKKAFPSETARDQAYSKTADSTQQIYKYFSEFTFLQLLKEYVERPAEGVERDHALVRLAVDKFQTKSFKSILEPNTYMERTYNLLEEQVSLETPQNLPPLYTRLKVEEWLKAYRENFHLDENFVPLL